MSIRLSTPKDCRDAYRDILQGFTHVEDKGFYIKHFKEIDLGFIENIFKRCSKFAESEGLLRKKEKLKFLKESGYWSEEEENIFISNSLAVKDGYEFMKKIKDPEQKKKFKTDTLKEIESKLEKIQKERHQLLEPTVESYCEKEINEHYVYHALYKDETLKSPFFTKEDFDDFSFIELADIIKTYNHEVSKFNEENIRAVSVNYFFLNTFFMCDDDPVKFYGKNVLDLTLYQLNLFSRGKFCKSILVEGREPPDQYFEESYENGLSELVNWYENAHNSIMSERKSQSRSRRR